MRGLRTGTRPRAGGRGQRRVLVLLGSRGIGDAAEALPVFELIHRYWPDAHVAAGLFKDPQRPIIERSPYCAEIVRVHGHIHDARKSAGHVLRNAAAMRGFHDVLVLARYEHVGWPIRLAARLAGVRLRHRHGYRYRDRRRSPFADFPAHVFFQIVTSTLLLERPLGEMLRPRLVPDAGDQGFAADFLARNGLTGGGPVAMINTRNPKYGGMGRWGGDRFLDVANRLAAAGVRVVLNGGDPEQVEEFAAQPQPLPPGVVVLAGPTPGQLAAVAARCDLFLGEPAGPLCVAMATGTPTLILEGPGEHDYPGHNRGGPVWWPLGPRDERVSGVAWCTQTMGEACRCSRVVPPRRGKRLLKSVGLWRHYKHVLKRLGLWSSGRHGTGGYPCLDAVTAEAVATAALEHLRATAHARVT